MRAVLEVFLVLFSVFVQQKVTVTENITFAESVSGIRSPDCSKLAKNLENDNDATISRNDVNIQFFWHYFVSLVKFSYWSKFCVNIITSSGIMTISFYKGLTRNLEIRNTPIWVSPNIWRLGQVMDTKFGMNVSNRMLVNAAKFQGYSFYTPPLPPLILGLKEEKWKQQYSCIWQTFRSSHQEELCWKVILKKFIKFSP